MGYISSQWLRKLVFRNASHRPTAVRITAKRPADSWSIKQSISVEIVLTRKNDDYQQVHLGAGEVARLLSMVVRAGDEKVRSRLIAELVRGMTDRQLLEIFALDLKTRLRKRPKRSLHDR